MSTDRVNRKLILNIFNFPYQSNTNKYHFKSIDKTKVIRVLVNTKCSY